MPSSSPEKRRARARPSRRRWLFAVGAVVVALALWLAPSPLGTDARPPERVLIPPGATFRQAADSLAAVRLIPSARVFSLYGKLRGRDRTIRAGTYRLAHGLTWDALIDALHTGRGLVATITIPEGWSVQQMIPLLSRELSIPAESLEAAVRDSALRARVGTPAETLEGYLFPETYVFSHGSTARQVVAAMVQQFERAWRPEWDSLAAARKRTRHEMVTMASIVEKEVQYAPERPIVAGVYWNRVRIGMALQADPTVIYALGKSSKARVRYSDLAVKSPYNTYRNPGLPPGPIASPGAAALEAAVLPASVPFRYFVATGDGRHEFRTTYAEHLAAVQQLRARQRAEEQLARADSVRRADSLRSVRGDSAAPVSQSRGRGGE